MAGPLTDDKAALIAMNHAMQKVTEEMGRLAVASGMTSRHLEQDFTRQIAELHWFAGGLMGELPFTVPGSHGHGGGFGPSLSAYGQTQGSLGTAAGGRDTSQGGGGRGAAAMPPSMRPRKYSGMGGYTDIYAHRGSEFATGYLMSGMLKGGTVPMDQMSELHAHLQGSRPMAKARFEHLMGHMQAANMNAPEGGPLPYSLNFMRRARQAYDAAAEKHELMELHQAGLRMPKLTTRDPSRAKSSDESFLPNYLRRTYQRLTGSRIEDAKIGRAERDKEFSTRKSTRALEDWTDKLKKFGDTLGEGGRGITRAGIMYGGAALQSASPDAFSTLTDSFKLLAASLGSSLIEPAAHASYGLQRLADKFYKLDEGGKKAVGWTFALGLGLASFAAAAPSIVAAFKILRGLAVGSLGAAGVGRAAGGALIGAAVANPVGAVAATAAVAGGGALWLDYQRRKDLTQEHEKLGAEMQARVHGMTNADVEKHPLFNESLRLPPEKRRDFLWSKVEEAAKVYQTQHNFVRYLQGDRGMYQSEEDLEHHPFDRAVERLRGQRNRLFNPDSIRVAQENERSAEEELGRRRELYEYNNLGAKKYAELKAANSPKVKDMDNQAVLQASGLLLSLQNRIQPQYLGIEDLGKKIQLEALAENPLQERIRQIQLDQLEKLRSISDTLQAIYSKEDIARMR